MHFGGNEIRAICILVSMYLWRHGQDHVHTQEREDRDEMTGQEGRRDMKGKRTTKVYVLGLMGYGPPTFSV